MQLNQTAGPNAPIQSTKLGKAGLFVVALQQLRAGSGG